jgi:hypothetical protein
VHTSQTLIIAEVLRSKIIIIPTITTTRIKTTNNFPGNTRGVHDFTGIKYNEAPHINKNSSPQSAAVFLFSEAIKLLVAETNRYYHQHLDTLDEVPSPIPDVTEFAAPTGVLSRSCLVSLPFTWWQTLKPGLSLQVQRYRRGVQKHVMAISLPD